ncbi:hypothetical protein RIF29_30578 [Crotalaria pallida]|uniref:Uncharacterized protein n=1 Tax=Crotalaria pallida TaxID=3830 RepID=A0AAN9EIF4_CROPI
MKRVLELSHSLIFSAHDTLKSKVTTISSTQSLVSIPFSPKVQFLHPIRIPFCFFYSLSLPFSAFSRSIVPQQFW